MSLVYKFRLYNTLTSAGILINKALMSKSSRKVLLAPINSNFAISNIVQQSRSYSEGAEDSKEIIDSSKDRSKVIPVDVSIRYLQSSAYQTTYGGDPVWTHYRRNHKGQIPPRKTRKRCIRNNVISTGNPCPICRDEYLVLHPQNTELLKQFICPHTGAILSYKLTGLCQRRHMELLVAIKQAKDKGLITFDLPFQPYNYSEYVDLSKVQ